MLGRVRIAFLRRRSPGAPGPRPHSLEACIVFHGLVLPMRRGPAWMGVVVVLAAAKTTISPPAFTCSACMQSPLIACLCMLPVHHTALSLPSRTNRSSRASLVLTPRGSSRALCSAKGEGASCE